jgi:3-phenylpropionate/trans-cinnamate dioxygenase ferredoxin subunit
MTQPAEYVRACALSDLPDEGVIGVQVNGLALAIARTSNEVFAMRDLCSHDELPLSDGDVYDFTIECAAHGSCFDLRTGKATRWPAIRPLTSYPARIEGNAVLVALPAEQPQS